MLNDKSILITGGTGSFGKMMVGYILKHYEPKKLIVFSRDELKQFEMGQVYSEQVYPALRYFIGDVRDAQRLDEAFSGVDIVIHAAALKQVPACEYNPFEAIKTNVLGGQNVVQAAIRQKVKQVVALSTDKAAAPLNLYGATKLCSDKLFIAGNSMTGSSGTQLSVVRYGNVVGSRGSVIPFFLEKRDDGVLPVTDERMTRFSISLEEAVAFVIASLDRMHGGELFVPKIPSYRILDVAKAIAPEAKIETIGIRPGEKLHECMITEDDARMALEFDDHFVIQPKFGWWSSEEHLKEAGGKHCADGFSYTSGNNTDWITVDQIRGIVNAYCEAHDL